AVPSAVFQLTDTGTEHGPESVTGRLKSVVPVFPSGAMKSPTETVRSGTKLAAMVWLAETPVKVKVGTAPTLEPSTRTSPMCEHGFAAIVKLWSAPAATLTAPLGAIDPFAPAEAVIVYWSSFRMVALVVTGDPRTPFVALVSVTPKVSLPSTFVSPTTWTVIVPE